MKANHLVAALTIVFASGSALATEYVDFSADFVPTKTRAEVRAELAQAYAKGLLNQNGEILVFEDELDSDARNTAVKQQAEPPKTRAEVRKEVEQARAQGLLDRNGETGQSNLYNVGA